jgi:putative SOS response-associated peptidase YedK
MCGRFTLRTPLVLAQQFLFDLGKAPAATQVSLRYNIAPTQTVAAVRHATAAQRGSEVDCGIDFSTWKRAIAIDSRPLHRSIAIGDACTRG